MIDTEWKGIHMDLFRVADGSCLASSWFPQQELTPQITTPWLTLLLYSILHTYVLFRRAKKHMHSIKKALSCQLLLKTLIGTDWVSYPVKTQERQHHPQRHTNTSTQIILKTNRKTQKDINQTKIIQTHKHTHAKKNKNQACLCL